MKFLLVLLLSAVAGHAQVERSHEALQKFQKAGVLAREGKYEPANQLMQQAFTEFDEAVKNAPEDYQARLLRGMNYSMLPEFLNKTAVAQADLEWVMARAEFAAEPEARQARVRERLAAVVPKTGPRDRFPQVAESVSPVIAVASYTVPGHTWSRAGLDERMKKFMAGLESHPGLVACHLLSSLDRSGMLVILTSWKDKKALNDWFFGSTHQGMIQEVYGGPRPVSKDGGPSQVAMELFTTLPGGMRFSGGLFTKDGQQ